MTDPYGHLRVGHAERDAAVSELQRAAAEGKLQTDELAQRTEAARQARTRADLAVVLADLQPADPDPSTQLPTVHLQQVEAYPAHPTSVASSSGPPGFSPVDPLILNAGFSSTKRTGPWQVPPFLRVQALADTVRMDCLQATATSEIIDLEVLPGAGTVVLVVPEGWGVAYDRLSKSWGTVRVKVPAQAAWGYPQIIARGSVGMGTFKARHANRFERRRLGEFR